MIPVPRKLLDFIREGGKFIVAGHKEPDGDCIGSQLALASVLDRLDKAVVLCSAGPFKRTEILPFRERFVPELSPAQREGARVIILDCGAPERTGELEPFIEGLPLAVIDHHSAVQGELPPDAIRFVDEDAPSVTFMVWQVVNALGLSFTEEEASLLFFGLCTDTGFFRHSDHKSADSFRAAASLVEAGANPREIWHSINGGKSLGSRNLMGIVLARAETLCGGRLAVTWEEEEETRRYGAEGRDSDSLYSLLLSIAGVEAVVVARQESPEKCAVGLRSRDKVDVARIAQKFGGGGHKNAAGAPVPGRIKEVLPQITRAFEEIL